MVSKEEVINRVYYDQAGYGSIKKTYAHANQRNNAITEADVKYWFHKNIQRKKDLAGYNSFTTSEPHEEYQMDLMFFCRSERSSVQRGFIDGGYVFQICYNHTYRK